MRNQVLKLLFVFGLFCATKVSYSQQATDAKSNKAENTLTGVLYLDSKLAAEKSGNSILINPSNEVEGKKSVVLAAAMSAVIPGAGEFYTGHYFKTAIFLAVEAAAITVGLMYDKKGNDQTDFFQGYADQHWSVLRYAKWTVKHAGEIKPGIDMTGFKVIDAATQKVNWSELNRLETELGSYYSHKLPAYGEQQYYELIGKYPQFNVGWDDFGDENTPFEYDPTRKNLTERFVYYSVERGKANDYYNIASKAVLVVVANHLISAVDAALSANSFNKSLTVNTSLEKFQLGLTSYYYPQLNLQYRF